MLFPLTLLVTLTAMNSAAAPDAAGLASISPWATGVTEEENIRKWLVTEAPALAGQGKTAEALAVIERAEKVLAEYTKTNDIPDWDREIARLYQLAQTKRASLAKEAAGGGQAATGIATTAEIKLTTQQNKTVGELRKKLRAATALVDDNKMSEAKAEIESVFKHLDALTAENKLPTWHRSIAPVYQQAADLEYEIAEASGTTEQTPGKADSGPGVGDPAPPLAVPGLNGTPVNSKDLAGKWVVVDFWATWCGPCRGEMPKLKKLHEQYGKDSRFEMVSVSIDTKSAKAKSYVAENGLGWTHGIVTQGWRAPIVKRYGVNGIPTILLISPEGKIVARGHSAAVVAPLAKALGKPPAVAPKQ